MSDVIGYQVRHGKIGTKAIFEFHLGGWSKETTCFLKETFRPSCQSCQRYDCCIQKGV